MFSFAAVKFKPIKRVPILIAALAVALVCLLRISLQVWPALLGVQHLEWDTFDWRVRQAMKHPAPAATNLAAVFIDDASLEVVNKAFSFSWPWPRQLHGKLVRELSAQGVKAVGFDVLFAELHPPTPETEIKFASGKVLSSDEYWAQQMRRHGNVVLSAFGDTTSNVWHAIMPAELFRTNAMAVGHATSDKDDDGLLRRTKAYKDDPVLGRIWHMGILLAAKELKLDLSKAVVEPDRIILRGEGGVERTIPLDREGFFYIDWNLRWNDPRLVQISYAAMLELDEYRQGGDMPSHAAFLDKMRADGRTNLIGDAPFRDKLVIVGSIGAGNNISDLGPTPLDNETYLVSKHWNVANSIITGRFIRTSSLPMELALIVVLGTLTLLLTWQFRIPWSSVSLLLIAGVYVLIALVLYVQYRYWLPIVVPLLGGLAFNHAAVVSYQVIFEQREKRRVKSVFAKVVSPNVVNELLEAEKLNMGGSRRDITVLFADVRGFTQMTDVNQANAEAYVRDHGLTGDAAEAYFDESAKETLSTVNVYLATIADHIKKHNGTLDKYIGDCVMAFWGAPTPNEKHAVSCVRAAVDAQRAMYRLNQERAAENKRREEENTLRQASGQHLLLPLALLSLGTGINSGVCFVGLMGSESHILNYTVFGREVNLASRLEGVSGRGRVIIGESTYLQLIKFDPGLAATCVEQPPVTVKGISQPVKIYEVPWKQGLEAAQVSSANGGQVAVTGFLRQGDKTEGTAVVGKDESRPASPALTGPPSLPPKS